MYEIIEKNQYGVKVKNTTGYWDCNLCKYDKKSCEVDISQCNIKQYYLPDSEAEKLESEKPTINGATPDVVNLNSDTQKELIDLRVELRVEKEKCKALIKYLEKNIERCKNTEHHYKMVAKKRSSYVNWAMGQAYQNVLEFIKNQK